MKRSALAELDDDYGLADYPIKPPPRRRPKPSPLLPPLEVQARYRAYFDTVADWFRTNPITVAESNLLCDALRWPTYGAHADVKFMFANAQRRTQDD